MRLVKQSMNNWLNKQSQKKRGRLLLIYLQQSSRSVKSRRERGALKKSSNERNLRNKELQSAQLNTNSNKHRNCKLFNSQKHLQRRQKKNLTKKAIKHQFQMKMKSFNKFHGQVQQQKEVKILSLKSKQNSKTIKASQLLK